jgi:predicted DNA-binding transcriptional regulator AlpA
MIDSSEKLLTPKELAERLGVKVNTLAGWRVGREGPIYIKVGRLVRYRAGDIEAYLQERTKKEKGAI